jgi:ribA/ribD-fused uncharacterized protein
MEKITSFKGEYDFLSNFYPCFVAYDGVLYPSAEHAYQAAKTDDPVWRERIRDCFDARTAKSLGTSKLKLRADWNDFRQVVMNLIVLDKFSRSPFLGEKLLATGDAELIEGNTWGDHYWGVCRGRGQNHLGRILMRVRAALAARGVV